MMANVQYITLKKHYPALVSLLKYSVSTITLELWSKSLIPKEVHDSIILTKTGEPVIIKAAMLISCITDRVQHGSPKTFYDFLDVLNQEPYFSDIVEKIRKSCACREEVEMFKKAFLSILERLQFEIVTNNDVSPLGLDDALTLLPESVQEEYRRFVSRKLGTLDRGEAFEYLFCHLKPYFTFLDYQVLKCLINHYGSTKLKEDMSAYHRRVRIFKERTTIQQVIDHEWLGQHDVPSHFSVLTVKILNFMHYTLLQLDRLKQRLWADHLSMSRSSECCLSLINVTMDGVSWAFPSLLNFPSVITLNGSSDDHDKDGGWGEFDDDKDNDQGGGSTGCRSRKRRTEAANKGDTKRQKQDHGKQAKQMLLQIVSLFEEILLPSRKEKQLHQLQRGRQLARNIQLQYY